MKKKLLFLSIFLLFSCSNSVVSTSGSSSLMPTTTITPTTTVAPTTTVTPTTTVAPTTSSVEETYKVVLPSEIDGVNVTLSNYNPLPGEEVIIYVATTLASKRVDSVSVYGELLTAYNTSDSNTKIYKFIMKKQNASISLEAVDVYPVVVSSTLTKKLALAGIGNGYFAEGETVSFTPTTYAGYWYKNIVAVDNVVELSEDNGVYSFTMPNSLVTIGAEVGENIYTVSHNEADPVYSLTLDNDYAALFDSRVQFKVNFVSNDYEVESVIVDNKTLTPSSTGVYSFMMPAYPVEIEVNYNKVYKEFTVVNSNHYGAELKTYDDTNTLIQVTNNNVISNQDVEVHLSPLNVDSDKFIVNGLTILAGNKSDALAEVNIAISKTDYGYKFTTSDEYRYYSLQLSETEKTSLMGTFKGVSPNDQYASVTTLSFENGVVSGEDWGTPYSAAYEFDGNVYSYNVVGKYSTNYFKFWTNAANNAILHFSYASDFGTGISANYRHQNTRLLFPSSLSIESYYSIITYGTAANGYNTEYFKQYYEYTLSDGSVVTCFIDFETDKVTWDVKLELLSGENGLTTGDVVEIKDGSDNTLAKMKIDSKSKSHKQYYAKDAA